MSENPEPLTGLDARLIGPGIPAAVHRVAVLLGVLVPIGFALAHESAQPVTAAVVESPVWLVGSAAQSVLLATVALVFVAPGAAVALAAVGAAAVGLIPGVADGVSVAWLTAAALLGAVAVADGVLTVQRRTAARLAERSAPHIGPVAAHPVALEMLRTAGRGRLVGGVGLLLLAGALVGWYVHDAAAAATFRADARLEEATVLSVSDDLTSAEVVIGGASYELPVTTADRAVGDVVPVRLDVRTGRLEALDDAFDPTTVLVPVAFAAELGIAFVVMTRRSRRRAQDLLIRPQPAVLALATGAARARGALLVAYDDVACTAAVAPRLVPVAGAVAEAWAEVEADAWSGMEEDAADDEGTDRLDDGGDGYDDGDGTHGLGVPARVSDLSDEELLALAGHRAPVGDAASDELLGPEGWDLTPVTVLGALDGLGPVAIVHGRDVYVGTAPVRFPAWRPLRVRRGPTQEGRSAWRSVVDGSANVQTRLGLAAGRWAPWVALPVVWQISAWVVSVTGPSWRLVVPGLVFVGAAWLSCFLGQSALRLGAGGLVSRGFVVDTVVPWGRVTGAAATEEAVVVRYEDGSEGGAAMLLAVGAHERRLTADRASAAEVATRVEWARSANGGRGGRVRRRPSVPTLLALCWLAAVFVPAWLAARP